MIVAGLLASAVVRPLAVAVPNNAITARAPAPIMQSSQRERLLAELDEFETKLQAGANRRSILAGLAAGAIGTVVGSNFGIGSNDPAADAMKTSVAQKENELAAATMQIAEREATLKALADRAAAAKAETAKNVAATELELMTKVEAAEARVAAAEARLAQNKRDAVAAAGQIITPTSVDLDSPVIGVLAVSALGEAAALIAANSRINGLKKQAADADMVGGARVSQVRAYCPACGDMRSLTALIQSSTTLALPYYATHWLLPPPPHTHIHISALLLSFSQANGEFFASLEAARTESATANQKLQVTYS